MRTLALLAAAILSTASVAAVGCGAGAAGSATGLRGSVTRGPTTPVCRVGVPCSAPAAHAALVFRRGGRTVRTRADTVGRFRVMLTPGAWSVSLPRGTVERLSPQHVLVVADRMRTVEFAIDTGIR